MDSSISWKDINKLALPAIIAGIAEPVISLVDTAVIGQLGTFQLGGVGVGASLFTLIMWVLAQTKSAISSIVSKAFGADSINDVKPFVPQALILNILLGVSVMIGSLVFKDLIFDWYNAHGSLKEYATAYYSIRAIGLPFGLYVFGVFGVFRGYQNTKWAMQISFTGLIINVIFDILLVFGIEGVIPKLGVQGAAIASVMAQVTMAIMATFYLLKKTPFNLNLSLQIHRKVGALLKMSFDLFIRAIALNTAFYVGTSFSTELGEVEVAAFTIGVNIWLFSSFFIDGYSNAGNAIAGRLSGGNQYQALIKVTHKLVGTNLAIAMGLSIIYVLMYPIMGSLFSNDLNVLILFNATFWLIIISQPVNAIAFTLDGIFKGMGETSFLRNLLLLSTFMVFVPSVFMFKAYKPGLIGIWISFILWMIARGFPIYVKLKQIVKRA